MKRIERTVMWRRLVGAGHDVCTLGSTDGGARLLGSALFLAGRVPCNLGYLVDADRAWRVRSAHVFGTVGTELVDVFIAAVDGGGWLVNGRPQPGTAGCVDLELDFTPATKLFMLRRLAADVGKEERSVTAHFAFPGISLKRQEQRFRRLSAVDYVHTVSGSRHATVLRVDADQSVVRWPGRFERESLAGVEAPGQGLATPAQGAAADRDAAQREAA